MALEPSLAAVWDQYEIDKLDKPVWVNCKVGVSFVTIKRRCHSLLDSQMFPKQLR